MGAVARMAKKTSRKRLLKSPDEFLTFSEKVALFARRHSRLFEMAGTAVAAALLIYLGATTYLNYVNKKGQAAYNKAYDEVVKEMGEKPGKRDLKKPEVLFEDVTKDYRFSRVSRLVPPQMAYIKFQEKKYNDAISLYSLFLKDSSRAMYRSLASVAIAACYEEEGKFPAAVDELKTIIDRPSSPFKDQAMLALARVYRLSKENEKAREVLKEFVQTFKDSPLLPLANAYLGEYGS
jgi:outer membrane protein assembly factor BamD (BamD/ComL family)